MARKSPSEEASLTAAARRITVAPPEPARAAEPAEPRQPAMATEIALWSQQPPRPESDLYELVNEAGDDRDEIQPGDQVILIVENDEAFARSCWNRPATRG